MIIVYNRDKLESIFGNCGPLQMHNLPIPLYIEEVNNLYVNMRDELEIPIIEVLIEVDYYKCV